MSTPIRPDRGKYNITYRNGAFRLNKRTAAEAGFPARLEVVRNKKSGEVLLFPSTEDHAASFKLTSMGQVPWGNSFSSFELARALGLPLEGETIYIFTRWDPEVGALRFQLPKNDKA